MMILHDSRSPVYRLPQGAVPTGSAVQLRVMAVGIRSISLRVWWNEAETLHPMAPVGSDIFACELKLPSRPGVLWYYFIAEDWDGRRWFYGNAHDRMGGVGELNGEEPPSYQMTIYDRDWHTPKWMRCGRMMQIFPDRFHSSGKKDVRALSPGSFYHRRWDEDPILVINERSGEYCANDFFGGDLRGIEQKLDYIAGLGITVIYLNPIFRARSNHKYDTADYMHIDPAFGTEDDFRELCAEARKRGIRVILDGVFSHTGDDSIYFNKKGNYGSGGAWNDKMSPYYSWYTFRKWPEEYLSWWGFQTLPTLNKDDPELRKFFISDRNSVVAHWLNAGASGWRLDVADELPMDYIRALRRREKAINPDAALIGEVWEDPSNKVAYGVARCYCLGDTLDATMNYPLRDAVLAFLLHRIDAVSLVRAIEAMRENLPAEFFYSQMNLLSSHDKPRALALLADIGDMEPDRRMRHAFDMDPHAYERGRRRLIAAWRLICALPGMPCLYYGDEAGLYGMSDPFCRGTYPWGREDAELVEEFRDAMQRRAASPALMTGTMKLFALGNDVMMVVREIRGGADCFGDPAPDEVRALAVNRADESHWVDHHGQPVEIPGRSAVWLD